MEISDYRWYNNTVSEYEQKFSYLKEFGLRKPTTDESINIDIYNYKNIDVDEKLQDIEKCNYVFDIASIYAENVYVGETTTAFIVQPQVNLS